jgi:multicomponent Na+:H+ antiporter subunit A
MDRRFVYTVPMEWTVPFVLLAALFAPLVHRALPHRSGAALALVPALVALFAALRQPAVARGEVDAFRASWIPSLGIDWAFRVDGLANLFVLLVAGIGALVVVYASGYLHGHPRLGRFYATLLAFMAGMLGLATADDLFLLFIFWELTTVSSFLLIGFQQEREAARRAALQSLLVTGAGGLALLAGIVLLVSAAGTSSLSELATRGPELTAHPHYAWILGLVLAGAFTKSAQFPFHFWLPAAMQAPTPVSAYLHSSTMVKAGVFLLARLSPALGGTELWLATLGGVGALTMLTGALLAVGQDDLKRLLAYSTVSILGLLTLLLGLGTPIAARAFAVTLLAHALYKGTLFLIAGNVDHATGTRSLARLGGLRHAMPWTAAAAGIAGISMAGAPPLFGFLAKETAYEAALEAPRAAALFGTATIATATLLVFAALRVALQPFAGAVHVSADAPHDPPPAMRFGPTALAVAGVLAGLLVGPAERLFIAPAATSILQAQAPTGLALWHGFTPILALSALTVAAGVGLYGARRWLLGQTARFGGAGRVGPGRAWDRGWQALLGFAAWQTRTLQNGSLRRYLAVTLTTAFVAALWGLADSGTSPTRVDGPPLSALGAAAGLLVVGGSVLMVVVRRPLVAVAALGAVGFGVALLFLLYSAPDLALTQLVVEVLTVVLLVFILRRLPRPSVRPAWTPGGVALAGLGGCTMAALTWVALQVQLAAPVSGFFEAQSVAAAHGRNVVNVILVDFRALDTLGEITVLAVAALGILAVLARRRAAATSGATP